MSFRDDWQRDKAQKRLERDIAQMQRRMSTPVARGEVYRLGELQMQHVASLALAIEALEDILVGAGILEPDQLMDVMHLLAAQKQEQAEAQQAADDAQPKSSLICSV